MNAYLSSLMSALAKYRFIYVSGPQRSGTRIASKIISFETGYQMIDETEFKVGDSESLRLLLEGHSHAVIQCPGLSHVIHTFSTPADCIVFMHRPIADIIKSQNRIKWECENLELDKYNCSRGPISHVKYETWHAFQKGNVHHPVDLNYCDLASHPFFVDKSDRTGFLWNQTAI